MRIGEQVGLADPAQDVALPEVAGPEDGEEGHGQAGEESVLDVEEDDDREGRQPDHAVGAVHPKSRLEVVKLEKHSLEGRDDYRRQHTLRKIK